MVESKPVKQEVSHTVILCVHIQFRFHKHRPLILWKDISYIRLPNFFLIYLTILSKCNGRIVNSVKSGYYINTHRESMLWMSNMPFVGTQKDLPSTENLMYFIDRIQLNNYLLKLRMVWFYAWISSTPDLKGTGFNCVLKIMSLNGCDDC